MGGKFSTPELGNYAPPRLLKFLATPLPALVVGEKNLVIGFGPPPLFRNAFAIADLKSYIAVFYLF